MSGYIAIVVVFSSLVNLTAAYFMYKMAKAMNEWGRPTENVSSSGAAPKRFGPFLFTQSKKRKPKVNDDEAAWLRENGR